MKKITFLLIFVCSFSFAQVGIGTTNPTGALDVSSTLPSPSLNKAGFVPPTVALSATNSTVITTTPSVSVVNPATNLAPVDGTIVYNTNTSAPGAFQVTPGFYFYNAGNWEKLTSGANTNWSLSGNASTTPGTNYIGTSDSQALVIKTNNTERMRVDAVGKVGIGTTPDASAMLDVSSTTQGFLMPRLTRTQILALTNPATGLIIYNTNINKFCVNIGTSATPIWKQLQYEDMAANSKQVFTYTGADQTFIVPAGITSIDVKIWGAGGGGSEGSGGSGAFIKGNLAVTPGQVLIIVVGKGGVLNNSNSPSGYGGGGASGPLGGSGGGFSGIFNSSYTFANALTIAGGGGGGGYATSNTYGGGGGATTGSNAGNFNASYTGGSGATITVGGGGGSYNGTNNGATGTALNGGSGFIGSVTYGGGGGGGGYYGGGGGYGSNHLTRYSSGGGGGSSFLGSLTAVTNIAGTISNADIATQAPGNTEAEYIVGIGNGGDGSLFFGAAAGGNGLIVITY